MTTYFISIPPSDCLGVFHRSQEQPAEGKSAEGDALRRWFRRLPPEKRMEALTIQDAPWVALLLAMVIQRRIEGPGSFFVDLEMPPSLRALQVAPTIALTTESCRTFDP